MLDTTTLILAVMANLREQKLLQNAVKEFLNFVSRDIGLLCLKLIFCGGLGFFRPDQDKKYIGFLKHHQNYRT